MAQQSRLYELTNQLQVARSTQQIKVQERKRTEATLRELEKLPADTATYRAVGRMFLVAPLPEVRSDLAARKDKLATEAATLQKNMDALERSIQVGEGSLRELVQKKVAAQAKA